MQKIIDNLLYDTDTATLLFVESDTGRRLYKTPSGNFFKFYKNGEFATMTESAVKEYLGSKSVETYIKVFGSVDPA